HFTVFPNNGSLSTIFHFDASASDDHDGRIVRYHWNFGDGTVTEGRNVQHKFNRIASFTVKLSVEDNDGLQDVTDRDLSVKGHPPVARFNISPLNGDVDTTFSFDASSSDDSDGRIIRYEWRFGDGGEGSGKVAHHHFAKSGSYSIHLNVVDNNDL